MKRDDPKESGLSSTVPSVPGLHEATPNTEALLAAYEELCKSYHAIDDFRMKLLGLLPLASLAGVFLLNSDALRVVPSAPSMTKELIGFAAIFGALLTVALFSYELRGIKRCHNLIREGLHLEMQLGIGHGQFHVCAQEHSDQSRITAALNAKFAACTIYSLVFSGWLFMALRFGFGIQTLTCSVSAVVVGSALAGATYIAVQRFTST
jgi:hypothetical protein